MNEFNTLVLNIAIIILILSLVVVGIILYFSIQNSTFPPFDTQCPTYYKLDPSGVECRFDTTTYGSSSGRTNYPSLAVPPSNTNCNPVPVSTFYGNGYSRDEILCSKNRWAKSCGVFWDGVTNNQDACFRQNSTLFPGSSGSSGFSLF